MFEEGQLYTPVSRGEDGDVTVHLADNHPGAVDPEYRARRNALATLAIEWQPGTPPPVAPYTEAEHEVWRIVCRELHGLHERLACSLYLEGKQRLGLPGGPDPSARRGERPAEPPHRVLLRAGRRPGAPAGVLRLAGRRRSSTPPSTSGTTPSPSTRPKPDVLHEVVGHGNCLAHDRFAALYRLAGDAVRRVQTPAALEFISKVFWFSLEFGVLREDGEVRSYGAGLLSSYGEIQQVAQADLQPLDVARMGVQTYDITHYQPVLFCGERLQRGGGRRGRLLRRRGRRRWWSG